MDVLTLCLRYIRSRKIAIVSLIFVAIAVTANIVVIAVMDGFQARIETHLRGIESDLTIQMGGDFLPINHLKAVSDELAGEMASNGGPIEHLSPHLQCWGLSASAVDFGHSTVQTHYHPVKLLGIDYADEIQVVPFRKLLVELRSQDSHLRIPDADLADPFRERAVPGVLIGTSLATAMGLRLGDTLQILTGRLRSENGNPNNTTFAHQNLAFQLVGCFDTGRDDYDMTYVYMTRTDFARLHWGANPPPHEDCKTVQARLRDGLDLKKTADQLKAAHPRLTILTWEDQAGRLMAAVRSEKAMIVIIIFFIIAVAAGSILGILYMMVIEKTRDIGILRSMGLSRLRVIGVFMGCGTVLGGIGSAAGLGLGLLIVRNINAIKDFLGRFGIEVFSEKVYGFKEIPTKLLPEWVAGTVIVAVLLSILAGVIPAALAARLDPVRCLKDE